MLTNRLKNTSHKVFVWVSRMAHRTPLQRWKWLARIHNFMFEKLSESSIVHVNGSVLHVDPRDRNGAKKLALYGEYEAYIGELLISLAVPGTAVVDVGANIGLHTVSLARRVGTEGLVFAFEPDPDNYALLTKNIEENGFSNVNPLMVALSSEAGTALLYQNQENRGNLSLSNKNIEGWVQQSDPLHVQTITGDEVFADISMPISLMKIDVEGAEPLVLRGLHKTLLRNPDMKLVFEFSPRHVRGFQVDPLQFLTNLELDGFSLAIIDSGGRTVTHANAHDIVSRGESTEKVLNLFAVRNDERAIQRQKQIGSAGLTHE